jgi:hypothetical protein
MNDNFSPTVSWTEAGAPTSYLYRIFRNQVFDVWLVAHRSGSSEYTALRHVAWQLPVVVEFTFDSDGTTSKPNHSSWLDKSGTSLTWSENPNNLPSIPSEAFRRPRVNAALGLYRYPADGSQKQFVAWA